MIPTKIKIPQSGICPAPCGLRQCARCFRLSFYQRLSSVKGRLPSKIVFRQRFSSVKVVFCQRSSSIKARLPSKLVFCQSSSSVKGCLPLKVVSLQRSLLPEITMKGDQQINESLHCTKKMIYQMQYSVTNKDNSPPNQIIHNITVYHQ